ncbi:type IV toxin-antitoxin system AbiEi family antitoxin domain-containing protein [Nonomuraea sp. CA-218870]|uniref:type IV toxin-antitoxin system AbiEi family antitoxin domain-containing protein n=1 Tax=Nonomuraea sp. CA-218870 TaxID=3239998 RepID=UPI003D932B23
MWEEQFADLSAVAARQSGLITTAQAAGVGVDEAALARFAETGLLTELDWAVHQLPWSRLGPRYAYPYAAWLALAPSSFAWERRAAGVDAALSHESACRLHGLGSVPGNLMIFTAPVALEEPRATRVHLAPLAPEDVTVVEGVPVTTAQRTIADLLADWTDHGVVRGILLDAVLKDLVDLRSVHEAVAPLAVRHEFPSDGGDFVRYFLPDLAPSQLSPRNLRSWAAMVLPDRVARVQREAARLLAEAGGEADARTSWELAADIVGRSGQTGSPG